MHNQAERSLDASREDRKAMNEKNMYYRELENSAN